MSQTALTGSALRERLESAYSQGLTEEAMRLSRMLDEMQLEIIQRDINTQPMAG